MKIDPPGIMEGRSPEQNISALKSWANDASFILTQEFAEMQSQIEELQKKVEELKEAGNGV